jgi:hypothetical protein
MSLESEVAQNPSKQTDRVLLTKHPKTKHGDRKSPQDIRLWMVLSENQDVFSHFSKENHMFRPKIGNVHQFSQQKNLQKKTRE